MKASLFAALVLVLNFTATANATAHKATPGEVLRALSENHMVDGALFEIHRMAGDTSTCTGLKIESLKSGGEGGGYDVTASASCETKVDGEGDDTASVFMKLEGYSFDGKYLIVSKVEVDIAG
jgi:hypothetical protein